VVKTEGYAVPPDAPQKPGPRPLGQAYQAPEGGIQTDFDAEMEPTYTNGNLYAQLTTGTSSGTSAADWFRRVHGDSVTSRAPEVPQDNH
jgi:hypothetical protein